MTGSNPNITRRLRIALLLGALFVGVLVGAAGASAAKPPPKIKRAFTATFPENVHGVSVAIAPDGTPWFGLSTEGTGPALGRVESGKLEVDPLGEEKDERGWDDRTPVRLAGRTLVRQER
ncbi:MAG TPA: hypothetical protein VGC32_19085 [Solirubrobacterales bacterium]